MEAAVKLNSSIYLLISPIKGLQRAAAVLSSAVNDFRLSA
jgi:hypothetical protein